MNPKYIPQNLKHQANHNLDESQSSSVSIKIFNKNDDNVVIRLYRNNTRTNRDRYKHSRGFSRQAAGRSEGRDKRKSTMFRNLYRNTFGPTIDETVLVGMETFQICQQEAPLNGQTFPASNASNEDFQRNGSIIPNELSWDGSTLLPTNPNEKQFENVCTNTSNCMLNKEMNLSPLVTNRYQYSPFPNKSQTETCCPYTPCHPTNPRAESYQVDDQIRNQNNVSSDENLSKHISSEGINASYKTDITRSTITDFKHDTNKTLASISTYSGTKDPSYLLSDLDSQKHSLSSAFGGMNSSESKMLDPKEITVNLSLSNNHEKVGQTIKDKTQVAESTSSTSSCPENCLLCRESIKKFTSSKSEDGQTNTEEEFALNLLPKERNPSTIKLYIEEICNPAAPYLVFTSIGKEAAGNLPNKGYNKYSFQKLGKSKSHPNQKLVKEAASFLSNFTAQKRWYSKNGSKTESTATNSFVLYTSNSFESKTINDNLLSITQPHIMKKPISNVVSSSLANKFPKPKKRNLKVVEFYEIPEWERQKCYPTAKFVRGRIKKNPLKKFSRLPAGSDRPNKMLHSSSSASSWMTQYSLRSNIKNIPSYKAREIWKDLQKMENKPVLKVKHVLSTSSSSNFSTTSSITSSIGSGLEILTIPRQRSGTNSVDDYKEVLLIHEKLAPMEHKPNDYPRVSIKERLNNSDIMLPPNESHKDNSINTRTSTLNPLLVDQKQSSQLYKDPNPTSRQSSVFIGRASVQKPETDYKNMYRESKIETPKDPPNDRGSFGRPKGEYCQSTGVIYTSEQSSAGICPNIKEVNKLWDHKDRGKRKPLLEKLVDVISDYSKGSSFARYPTYCTCTKSMQGDYKKKAPRRTPILQKLFGVFSKKEENHQPPKISVVNFDDGIQYEDPIIDTDFEPSPRAPQTLKLDRHVLDEQKDYFKRHTSLHSTLMEEKYPEMDTPNYFETENPKYFETERSKSFQTEKPIYFETERPKSFQTEKPIYFETERPKYFEAEKPKYFETESPKYYETERPTCFERENSKYFETEKPKYTETDLEDVEKRRNSCKIQLRPKVNQSTETEKRISEEFEERLAEEFRKHYMETEMKKSDEHEKRRKCCECQETKQQFTESYNNTTSGIAKEERRSCNKHTCATRKIYADSKQQWDENKQRRNSSISQANSSFVGQNNYTETDHNTTSGIAKEERQSCNKHTCATRNIYADSKQQWDENKKRRNSSISQANSSFVGQNNHNRNSVDFKENGKSCCCEIKKSSSLNEITQGVICHCKKEDSRQSVSNDDIHEGKCCDSRRNSNSRDFPDPRSLSLSSSSPQASFRSTEVKKYKKKSKNAAGSDYNRKPTSRTLLDAKDHIGSKQTSQTKKKKKKPKNTVTFHINTISEGRDIFTKKRKASSNKKYDGNYPDEEKFKESKIRNKLNNILERGIQMDINDSPAKTVKPLMWRSFMENEHFKDVVTHSPQRKPSSKDKPKTANAEEQSKKLMAKLCKKCSICSKKSGIEICEVKEKTDICSFRNCSNESVTFPKIKKLKKHKRTSSFTRYEGGCELNRCDIPQPDFKVFKKKLSDYFSKLDLDGNYSCTSHLKSRRRSGQENPFSKTRALSAPSKKAKGIRKCLRISSGYDAPRGSMHEESGRLSAFVPRNSEVAPRNSRRSSARGTSCMHGLHEEGCVAGPGENSDNCNCSPSISERQEDPRSSIAENQRRPSEMSEWEANLRASFDENRRRSSVVSEKIPESTKRCTFHETLPRNSQLRGQSITSQPYEDYQRLSSFGASQDYDDDVRRSSGQWQSTDEIPTAEPSRRVSNRISDYFRRNSRKSTNGASSPAKSIDTNNQIDGYTRIDIDEEMPRMSAISPESYESENQQRRRSSTPRRSSMPRESCNDADDEYTQVDNLRRSTKSTRESEGLLSKIKRKISQSAPCQSESIQTDYIRTGSMREDPRQSINSAQNYEPELQEYRRSSTPRRSSISPRRSSMSPRRSSMPCELDDDGDGHAKCVQMSSPRRSSLHRKTFEEDIQGDDLTPEEVFYRSSIASQRRESTREENIETDSQENLPRVSDFSAENNECQHEEARRSSTPRPSLTYKSFIEDYVPTHEDTSRRSTYTERRESQGRPSIYDEQPRVSTFSPEFQGYEESNNFTEDYPTCSSRRKSRQLSSPVPYGPDEARQGQCQCIKGTLSRNNIPQETRYAITRVTRYDDYTTYEILKSTRAKPKKIPQILEKIFIEKDL